MYAIIISVTVLGVAFFLTTTVAEAQSGGALGGVSDARGTGVPANLTDGDGSIVSRAINLFLYIIGVISVIMLIYGGFQYITSAGNAEKVKNAKNTILYAIVGLLIAIFAYAIISFVLNAALGLDGGTDI